MRARLNTCFDARSSTTCQVVFSCSTSDCICSMARGLMPAVASGLVGISAAVYSFSPMLKDREEKRIQEALDAAEQFVEQTD